MRSLARVLAAAGWKLSGSDLISKPLDLANSPITTCTGHAAHQVPDECDLLIHSAAIPESNVERQAAQSRGVKQLSYVSVLAELMSGRGGISVAGTHGKSSTTAMIGSILREAGRTGLALFGAELIDSENEFLDLSGPVLHQLCVVESCEFREHFLQLRPQMICLTSIEADHFDCYPTLAAAREAYLRFLHQLPETGLCVFNANDAGLVELLRRSPIRRVSYSMSNPYAEWSTRDLTADGSSFDLMVQGSFVGRVHWSQWGRHQVANGLAAAATCSVLGIEPETIVAGLSRFQGLRRRLEHRGEHAGVVWLDDYAHHPTAIQFVLQAIRERYAARGGKLWCAFQPHQLSRTLNLLEEFARSLTGADQVFILPVFGARESGSAEFVEAAQALTLRIQQAGRPAMFVPTHEQLHSILTTEPSAGDVVVTLGAGDIDRIEHEYPRTVS